MGRGSRTPTGFSAPVSRAGKPEMRGARGPRPEASRGEDPPPAPVPIPSGSWDRGARVCCLSAAASFLRGPPCRRLTHGSLLPQSQRGAVCEGGRWHGLARTPSPWPCSVGRRRPRSPTLQEKGSHERRNARGRGPWGPPSSLPAMLPKPSSGFSPFSLPRFLVVWVVYIFTFLPTPRPSQQRLELTRLRVLPRDEPRSFNS